MFFKIKIMLKHKRKSIHIPQSSVVLNLAPILKTRNITQPMAFLIKIGLNNVTAHKMLKETSVQVNYNQLTKLCLHLNCTPNDLFVLRDMQLPDSHALHALKTVEEASKSTTINEWLAGKTMAEVEELLKK